MATTETMDSCKPAYADSPDRMQDFGVVEEDDSTSASDIMNDKERWMIDYDIHNLRKYTPPQHSLPLPPANATLPDLFDLTASQRTEFIERARRDSQSDGSQHDEPWCNDRHHTRRRCCSPTPVRDLMEKGEKILGDAVRPYESMKVPQSPQKVGVGFGSIPGTENRPFSDADSIASHQMHTNDDMYPGTPSVTPNTKLGSMPWVIGGVFDGCDDRGANTDTAVDSYCSPMGKIEDSKHARESPHLGAWRINTPDRSSSLGVVIRNPPCFGGEGLGSPKRLNPKRGSPLRREGRKWSQIGLASTSELYQNSSPYPHIIVSEPRIQLEESSITLLVSLVVGPDTRSSSSNAHGVIQFVQYLSRVLLDVFAPLALSYHQRFDINSIICSLEQPLKPIKDYPPALGGVQKAGQQCEVVRRPL
ncbi:MAG: hypothetical protein M1830_000131 [Pleopsidium flavum]|nr:MAG: hypothetical protein M1830_000131 [Pleopsidium flavum]